MAKEEGNVVEQHVEKAVLAVTALLLLIAVFVFLLSSPTQVLAGRERTPGEIDKVVREHVQILVRSLGRYEPPPSRVPDYAADLDALLGRGPLALAGLPAEITRPTRFQPPPLDIEIVRPDFETVELAEVVAPSIAEVQTGQSVGLLVEPTKLELPPIAPGGDGRTVRPVAAPREFPQPGAGPGGADATANQRDIRWASVWMEFSVAQQVEAFQKRSYGDGFRDVLFARVDVQRQRQRADGSWPTDSGGQPLWQDVDCYVEVLLPPPPSVQIDPEWKQATEATAQMVRAYRTLLQSVQVALVKPTFPQVIAGDTPVPPETFRTWGVSGEQPGPPVGPERGPGIEEMDPQQRALELLKQARAARNDGNLQEALRLAQQVVQMQDISRVTKNAAERLVEQIRRRIEGPDRRQPPRQPDRRMPDWGEMEPPIRPLVPPTLIQLGPGPFVGQAASPEALLRRAEQAMRQGRYPEAMRYASQVLRNRNAPQQTRARAQMLLQQIEMMMGGPGEMDILPDEMDPGIMDPRFRPRGRPRQRPGERTLGVPGEPLTEVEGVAYDLNVVPGATYRYRVRFVLYNNYVGIAKLVKHEQDARKVLLTGTWSAPSKAVTAKLDSRFFLVSAFAQREEATFEVYKWSEGYWRQARFGVMVGQEIGQEKEVRDAFGAGGKIPVQFQTGCTVIDMDSQRSYRYRLPAGDLAFRLITVDQTTRVVYLDREGRLQEAVQYEDARSAERKKYRDLAR